MSSGNALLSDGVEQLPQMRIHGKVIHAFVESVANGNLRTLKYDIHIVHGLFVENAYHVTNNTVYSNSTQTTVIICNPRLNISLFIGLLTNSLYRTLGYHWFVQIAGNMADATSCLIWRHRPSIHPLTRLYWGSKLQCYWYLRNNPLPLFKVHTILFVVVEDLVSFSAHLVDLEIVRMCYQHWKRRDISRDLIAYYKYMMTSSNGNIFRVTGPLCGEFTGHRWIPRTKASDAELWCFLWPAPE